jgi:uncharacterized membrane protein (UPF0127 family)
MRKWLPAPKVFLCIAGLSILVLTLFLYRQAAWAPPGRSDIVRLQVRDKIFELEAVSTEERRQQGLSGREKLGENEGMLFVFETAAEYCFWMKDMRFEIDMVWLDTDKRIVHVKEKVAPATYPENFCPPEPARYVLEVAPGTARQVGLHEGMQLNF